MTFVHGMTGIFPLMVRRQDAPSRTVQLVRRAPFRTMLGIAGRTMRPPAPLDGLESVKKNHQVAATWRERQAFGGIARSLESGPIRPRADCRGSSEAYLDISRIFR
jgi:hypothetical protein